MMTWLEDMVKTGVVSDVEGYLVGGKVEGGMGEIGYGGGSMEAEADAGAVQGADLKGKGKEKAVGVKMVDITNSV